MTERVVEMIFRFAAGETEFVLNWFRKLGCTVEFLGESSWKLSGLTGQPKWCGLMVMPPVDLAPVFGLILAGIWWPRVYPDLLKRTDKEFKRRKKEATRSSGNASPP